MAWLLVFAFLVVAFLVVIPSGTSESAFSRSLLLSLQTLGGSGTDVAFDDLGRYERRTGDSRFARYARNDNQKGSSNSKFPAGMTSQKGKGNSNNGESEAASE